jgi:2Fe-2S ferredoxin
MPDTAPTPDSSPPAATRPFQVTFSVPGRPEQTVTVDPARIPYGHDGLPGSLLDIALGHGIPLEHACGGVCACSTCHVIVRAGLASCNEATEKEEDQLDEAPGVTSRSRLACACVPDGSSNLRVEIPSWNRNLVRESE